MRALTAVGNPYEFMVAGRFIFGVSEGAIFIALLAGLAQWFSRSGIAPGGGVVPEPCPRMGSYGEDTSTPAWAHSLVRSRLAGAHKWLGTAITLRGSHRGADFLLDSAGTGQGRARLGGVPGAR